MNGLKGDPQPGAQDTTDRAARTEADDEGERK